jgi:hypothetical protein
MNMNLSELINEILSEWAYRCDDGMPNPKNPTHLKELGIVLSEMGLSHIEGVLVENLLTEKGKTPDRVKEAEGSFTNPVLNKKIKYKNTKGEDAEGIVGNLLRLPAEHPGRKAAEALLPADGTPERDKMNQDLGGQGQSGGAEKPKDGKGGEEPAAGGGGEEEKAKAAQAMFDPKNDPAMAARLDTEKEVQAQLAKDTEADKEAEKEQEPKEDDEFNPIDSKDVAKEMPEADPETFAGGSDIPDGVTPEELDKFNTDIQKVAQQIADAKAKGEQAPNINLCDVTVPGTNLYCDDNLGIPRDEMPQFKGTAQPGSRAAGMEADASGEVDTEPVFREMLQQKGIKTLQTEIPADKLKATQKDLVGAKVIGMMGALEKDPTHPKITAPIYVSRDGHVIDGHHRWAAIVAYNAAHPDAQIPMKTTVLDMDIKDAIPMANKFAEDMGIAAKKADANKEDVVEPKAAEVKSNKSDPTSNVKTFKGESSGKEIKTVELEGGGFLFGTQHGDTKMADDIINQVKATIPKERWKDVVFVGEGGATGDSGELEFNDEMEYSAPKFKEMGASIDTWDGDELDVHNDQSGLYKSQAEQTGLSQSKIKAGNWASMIGQGEGTDTMSPNDYLDDEGKEFLQNAAKEAGFPPIENWDTPSEQDNDTLYRLSFPEDNGDKETGVNDVQVAFNKARDLNLIKKQKELAASGKIPVVMAGESHADLVDNIMKGNNVGTNKGTTSEPQRVTSAPKLTDKVKQKISNWTEKEKAFFDRNEGAPGSKERRSLGQALKDKAAGALKAIKKGVKHEIEEFKEAGNGVQNFFSGKPLSEKEEKALKAVAFKVVTTAIFGAAFGGLSHGVAAFGKHVAMEFIPHVIGETILKGVGKAAVFADMEGEAETDANILKFTEMIAKGLEEMEITPEMMEKMVDSYNEKKENGEVETEKPAVKAEHLHLVDELMLEMIYGFIEEATTTKDWKLAARIGGPDGKIVYFGSKERKKEALDAGTHVDVDKKLQAKGTQPTNEPVAGADLFGQDYKDARGGGGTTDTKKVNYDSRVDGETSSKVEQTFNTDSKFSEPGMKHEDRVKRLEAMKATKINKVEVDDVYTAMGVDRGTTKFPAKYMSVLANALNFAKGKFTITDLTDAAGAGTLDSTLGELVTLMGATLQDPAQRKQFFDWARDQVKAGGNKSALTIAWINSAQDSCEAFHRKLKKDCPGGHEVNTNFWDIPSEAKAAGVKNYKRDKGKSTDINTMVDCIAKDGTRTQKWLQPSLKKNKKVNGFNSTTGRVFATTVLRWASPEVKTQYSAFGDELDSYEGLDDNAPAGEYTITDKKGNVRPMTIKERKTQLNKLMQNIEKDFEDKIPSEANPKLARERQDTLHKKMENDENVVAERNEFLTKYLAMTPAERKKVCAQISKDLNQKGDKYAMELMETLDALAKYDLTTAENFDLALEEMGIKNPKDRRKLNSALMNGVVNSAGNKTQSAKFKEKITKNSHDHSKAVLEYLISDNENKKALLENISTQFPLKDLMEGKEWAILGEKGGGINLDRDTITKCLGADKFEDVVEKLIIVDYNGEPTLAYAADNGKRTIPIGVLNCRPDGIMYGSTWKLELSIHEGFADCCKSHDK